MKNLLNYSKIALFLSLSFALISCGGGGDDPTPDPLAEAAALFSGKVATLSSAHTQPNDATVIDFAVDGFTVTITGDETGGTYTSNSTTDDQKAVWPTSGTWTFSNEAGTAITRDGSVPVTISPSATGMTLGLTLTNPESRVNTIEGAWSFTFSY